MDLKEVRKKLSVLNGEIKKLREEISIFKEGMFNRDEELHREIKAHGLQVYRYNPADDLILSSEASPDDRTSFYQLLRHYSFRLFMRDVISTKGFFRADELVRYCSLNVARQYIAVLCELKIAECVGDGEFHLLKRTSSPCSFGPTLEWFVAEIFRREFASPAIYGVRFKETYGGGDYDVIALWERRLVYVETKSSPPRGIDRGEIKSFLERATALLPDIAFLFNDTHLRMKDKIVVMFEEELRQIYGTASCYKYPLKRMVDELFHINHRIYIANSKKDIVTNFSLCLRDFLLHKRADLFPIAPPYAD